MISQFGKSSAKGFQIKNYSKYFWEIAHLRLPHGPKNSLESRGLSQWLWLSRILGQAKAMVRP
jgi:hypothetical protein